MQHVGEEHQHGLKEHQHGLNNDNKLTMKFSIVLVSLQLVWSISYAQFVIAPSTQMRSNNNISIMIQSGGNLMNNSDYDFSAVDINAILTGPVTEITGNWNLRRLRLNADGVIDLNGLLTVSTRLEFVSGIIRIGPSQFTASKFSFTGSSDNLIVMGDESYVEGAFFQTGDGDRQFPVGTSSSYAPVRLPTIHTNGEIGVEAFDGDPQLTSSGDVLSVNSGRYWQITSSDLAQVNSIVNVSTLGVAIPSTGGPTIVQAETVGGTAVNLKTSSVNDNDLTSLNPVTASIVAIGQQDEVVVKIHDLITPFKVDEVNDKLFIENIERFSIRKVTLLDRWGKVIKEWGNEYTNEIDFDFSKLSPGHYICVAEFGNAGTGTTKISQMITVLKANTSIKN
jgi:hypothetical protein